MKNAYADRNVLYLDYINVNNLVIALSFYNMLLFGTTGLKIYSISILFLIIHIASKSTIILKLKV